MDSTFDTLFYKIIENSRHLISLPKEKSKSRKEVRNIYDTLIQTYTELNSCFTSNPTLKQYREEIFESLYMFSVYLSKSLLYKSYIKQLSHCEYKLHSILETFLVTVEQFLDENLQSQDPIF